MRIVKETGKPVAEIAGDWAWTGARWATGREGDRVERAGGLGSDERAELVRLREENAASRMERDVLKRSAVVQVSGATR